MSVLICTPAYGGNVTSHYCQSMSSLAEALARSGIGWDHLVLHNESLIQRARNTCAATFLDGDWDHLFFIDADIEFSTDDFGWVMMTEEQLAPGVVCGIYRMKKPGSRYAAWVDGKLLDDLNQFDEPFEVDYAGTGFMCIHRRVFEKLIQEHPEWEHEEGTVGKSWAFFQCPLEDGIQLSEDYFFCKRWREHGAILAHPKVKLKHWGQYCYGLE